MRNKPYYTPAVPPTEAGELPTYLQNNMSSISSMLNSPVKHFPPLNKEPLKPREGDLAFADGSAWDPGEGRGLYYFDSAWIKL